MDIEYSSETSSSELLDEILEGVVVEPVPEPYISIAQRLGIVFPAVLVELITDYVPNLMCIEAYTHGFACDGFTNTDDDINDYGDNVLPDMIRGVIRSDDLAGFEDLLMRYQIELDEPYILDGVAVRCAKNRNILWATTVLGLDKYAAAHIIRRLVESSEWDLYTKLVQYFMGPLLDADDSYFEEISDMAHRVIGYTDATDQQLQGFIMAILVADLDILGDLFDMVCSTSKTSLAEWMLNILEKHYPSISTEFTKMLCIGLVGAGSDEIMKTILSRYPEVLDIYSSEGKHLINAIQIETNNDAVFAIYKYAHIRDMANAII